MKKTIIAKQLILQHLMIYQLVFDNSYYLTLWAQVKLEDGWQPRDLIVDYAVLNQLLEQAGEPGDEIKLRLADQLARMETEPASLHLEEQLGAPLELENVVMQATYPLVEDAFGNWVSDEAEPVLYVQSLQWPPEARAALRLPALLAPDGAVRSLISAYELYLGYLELDFEENAARQHAQLADDEAFACAYRAWRKFLG